MSLGNRIKEKRAVLDYTLEDVALALGTTRQTIQKYENGKIKNIPSDKIEALASVLKTTPAYLMGWEEKKTILPLSANEEKLVSAYRNQPDLQKAVDRLLGIDTPTLKTTASDPTKNNTVKLAAFGDGEKIILSSNSQSTLANQNAEDSE